MNWAFVLVLLFVVGLPLAILINGLFLQIAAGMADVPAERAGYLRCTGVGFLVGGTYLVISALALLFVFMLNRRGGFPSPDSVAGFSQVLAFPAGLLVCSLWTWLFFRGGYGRSLLVQLVHFVSLVLLGLSLSVLFIYGGYWLAVAWHALNGRPS